MTAAYRSIIGYMCMCVSYRAIMHVSCCAQCILFTYILLMLYVTHTLCYVCVCIHFIYISIYTCAYACITHMYNILCHVIILGMEWPSFLWLEGPLYSTQQATMHCALCVCACCNIGRMLCSRKNFPCGVPVSLRLRCSRRDIT